MAANSADLLKKSKSLFATTLSSSVDATTTTIPLNSVSGLPTDTAVTLTIDKTGTMERVTGTVSGSSLINCTRGDDSTTGAAHASGITVQALMDGNMWNDLITGLIAEHSQLTGLHATTRPLFIPATAIWPRTTTGCAGIAQTELATNKVNYQSLDFDTTTQEYAQFSLIMPGNWDAGTITFQPHWTAASGTGTVVWSLSGRSYADDDALDQASGTVQTSTDTLITASDAHIAPASAAITITGATAGEFVHFEVSRVVGSDTLNADAKLLGILIVYTATKLAAS